MPGRSETEGTIVQIQGPELCQLYDDPRIKNADYFVKPATIHLRYYCEQWMDLLLGWIKHYFISNLHYRRYEDLSGYPAFVGRDPGNAAERDILWDQVLSGFLHEVSEWLATGRDPRALGSRYARQ